MPFETPTYLNGLFDVVNVSAGAVVKESGGANPTTIIRTDQTWWVEVAWETTGPLVSLIAGTWHLHVYLESMGPGPEYELYDQHTPPEEHDIPVPASPGPIKYVLHPDIDPGKVQPGAYKLVVTVTYTDRTNAPYPMAGYWEGPIVQFIQP